MKQKKSIEARPEVEMGPVYVSELEEESLWLLEVAESTEKQMEEYYLQMVEEGHLESETEGKIDSLKRAEANMSKALAKIYRVSDELHARWSDLQKEHKKKKLIGGPPANATIDLQEKESGHFASGMNLYKLLLICFIGSFLGVVIEMLWCLLRNGYIESRAGLVYGPFNLLYGAGAMALSVCLYKFRNRGSWLSFLGGMIVGSVVEYLCSWGQEMLLGSRSWDYSGMPFNLNGRICLLYSCFWGFLGVVWIKKIYPRMASWILKIPNREGKIATWAAVVFFVFNSTVSCVSVFRWSQRVQGVEPANGFYEFIDERFPDERMETIYANMEFQTTMEFKK